VKPAGANNLVLSSIPWDVFSTLTFAKEQSRDSAWRKIEVWLRRCSRACSLNFNSNFFFAVRFELGEKGGRLHAHVLLRVPRFARGFFLVAYGRKPACAKWWVHGLTKFRAIEGSDPAISYFEKLATNASGADEYERRKTDFATDMVFGEAVIRRALRQQSAPIAILQAVEGQSVTLAGIPVHWSAPAKATFLPVSVVTGAKIAR